MNVSCHIFYRIHSSFTKTDTRKLICIISFLYRTLIIVCWRDGDLNDRHIFKIKRVEKILQIMLLFKSKKWTTYVHINSMWCFFKYTKEVQIESTHFKNSTTGRNCIIKAVMNIFFLMQLNNVYQRIYYWNI